MANAQVADVMKIILGKRIDVLYRGFKTTITEIKTPIY